MEGENVDAKSVNPLNPLHKEMIRLSVLCNDSTNENGQRSGDPTETAMIDLSSFVGVPPSRLRAAYPRNQRKAFHLTATGR